MFVKKFLQAKDKNKKRREVNLMATKKKAAPKKVAKKVVKKAAPKKAVKKAVKKATPKRKTVSKNKKK
jgi:DNA-binding protein HU-beta